MEISHSNPGEASLIIIFTKTCFFAGYVCHYVGMENGGYAFFGVEDVRETKELVVSKIGTPKSQRLY